MDTAIEPVLNGKETDMTKIVIVNDGVDRWAVEFDRLVSAMDSLGWEKGRSRLGMACRIEPKSEEDETKPYIVLCETVGYPTDMPEDTATAKLLTYYPDENAWVWER